MNEACVVSFFFIFFYFVIFISFFVNFKFTLYILLRNVKAAFLYKKKIYRYDRFSLQQQKKNRYTDILYMSWVNRNESCFFLFVNTTFFECFFFHINSLNKRNNYYYI